METQALKKGTAEPVAPPGTPTKVQLASGADSVLLALLHLVAAQ